MEGKTSGGDETHKILRVWKALKQASHQLRTHPTDFHSPPSSSAINALLELQTEANSILSDDDPLLYNLSHHLSTLKTLAETFQGSQSRLCMIRSFVARRVTAHRISKVTDLIESDMQVWIDRENVASLNRVLLSLFVSSKEEQEGIFLNLVYEFNRRLSQGFDLTYQDLVLKMSLFQRLESILCGGSSFSKRVREAAASAIAELIKFNKDVFVGQILTSQIQVIRSLQSIGTAASLRVLCDLIKWIKSLLVDDIQASGAIPSIIDFLSSEDVSTRAAAMDCVLEIGHYGSKGAVEAMMEGGLVKKLVEMQRSELEGRLTEEEEGRWVARFAVKMEVGEGLNGREKRLLKEEMMRRVSDATVSNAEAASIIADVLWASYP